MESLGISCGAIWDGFVDESQHPYSRIILPKKEAVSNSQVKVLEIVEQRIAF